MVAEKEGSKIDRSPNKVDDMLISWAGVKTPNEVADLTGIPAADVARRTNELLDSIDILTVQRKRAKLMVQLENMVAESTSRMKDAKDRDLSTMMNGTRATISAVLKEIRDMENDKNNQNKELMDAHTRRFVEIIQRAMDRAIGELSARYPLETEDDISLLVENKIREIAQEYDVE